MFDLAENINIILFFSEPIHQWGELSRCLMEKKNFKDGAERYFQQYFSYILVVICIDYIGSCKSNYHTIMTTMALYGKWRKSSLSVCRCRVGQQIDPWIIWSEALFGLSVIIQIYPYTNETQWLFWGPSSWINIDYNGEMLRIAWIRHVESFRRCKHRVYGFRNPVAQSLK